MFRRVELLNARLAGKSYQYRALSYRTIAFLRRDTERYVRVYNIILMLMAYDLPIGPYRNSTLRLQLR